MLYSLTLEIVSQLSYIFFKLNGYPLIESHFNPMIDVCGYLRIKLIGMNVHTGLSYLLSILCRPPLGSSIKHRCTQENIHKHKAYNILFYSWANTKIVYNPFLKVIYIACFNCGSWEVVPYFNSGRKN